MKLSVIIPVYRVENSLRDCVQSVRMQMNKNMEMILVEDASPDQCGMICEELAAEDTRIRVIHRTKNGGLSAARNTGLDQATGDYLTFVDSDDQLAPGTLEPNLQWLEAHPEVDLLEYPVTELIGNKQRLWKFQNETVTQSLFADWLIRKGYQHCYMWNKIYRKELWDSLRFPQGEVYEDTAVMPLLLERCKGIFYSETGNYRYFRKANTITTTYRYSQHRYLLRNNLRLYQKAREMELPAVASDLWNVCVNLLVDLARCRDCDREDLHRQLTAVSHSMPSKEHLLHEPQPLATRIKNLFIAYCGLETFCKLNARMHKPLSS